jgi:hypothetical protein
VSIVHCVECGYASINGLLHYDSCRLIILQWIHIEGKGENYCEFEKLTNEEIVDLATMENEMMGLGAIIQSDGYFGRCVLPHEDGIIRGEE